MRSLVLSLPIALALTAPAFAYDDCGNPPEGPGVTDPKSATADDVRGMDESDTAFGQDVEGYLICLQLAESDVRAEAEAGQRTAGSAAALRTRFQEQAANARGRLSGWQDEYDRWKAAWARAHGKPAPDSGAN